MDIQHASVGHRIIIAHHLHSIAFILRGFDFISILFSFVQFSRSLYRLMRTKLAVIMDQLLSGTETVIIYRRCLLYACVLSVVCIQIELASLPAAVASDR